METNESYLRIEAKLDKLLNNHLAHIQESMNRIEKNLDSLTDIVSKQGESIKELIK